MATGGTDRQLKIFDLRTYKPLQAYRVPYGAGELCFSQRGLLAAACNNIVEVKTLLFKKVNTITSHQAFSQGGGGVHKVRVSYGPPIADFGHPNIL